MILGRSNEDTKALQGLAMSGSTTASRTSSRSVGAWRVLLFMILLGIPDRCRAQNSFCRLLSPYQCVGRTFILEKQTNAVFDRRTSKVLVGDIDGDADADIMAVSSEFVTQGYYDRNSYWVYENLGGTRELQLAESMHFSNTTLDAYKLQCLADINGDDRADLIVIVDEARWGVILNNGKAASSLPFGAVANSYLLPLVSDYPPWILTTLDVDGDRDLDVIMTQEGHVYYYENVGNATHFDFVLRNRSSWWGIEPNLLASGASFAFYDADNDGDQDCVVASDTELHYFENQGTSQYPSFVYQAMDQAFTDGIGMDMIVMVSPGDLNGDGVIDLVVANASRIWSYMAIPSPTLSVAPLQLFPFAAVPPTEAVMPSLVDLDGDGDLDLVTTVSLVSEDEESFRYNINNGNATAPLFEATRHWPGWAFANQQLRVSARVLGDLKGDGRADLLQLGVYDKPDGRIDYFEIFFASKLGILSHNTSVSMNGSIATECEWTGSISALVDIDEDGDLDLVFPCCSIDCTSIQVLYNAGNASMPSFAQSAVRFYDAEGVDIKTKSLSFVDFDGDGDVDLITSQGAMHTTEPMKLIYYENQGTVGEPRFVLQPQALFAGRGFPGPVVLADLDSDGRLDLVVGSMIRREPLTLLMNGRCFKRLSCGGRARIKQRDEDDTIKYAKFLYEAYKGHYWWWEAVECVRRLLLTALLDAMFQTRYKQALVGIVVSVVYIRFTGSCHPYLQPSMNTVSELLQWQTLLTLLSALVGYFVHNHSYRSGFGLFLLFMVLIAPCLAAVALILQLYVGDNNVQGAVEGPFTRAFSHIIHAPGHITHVAGRALGHIRRILGCISQGLGHVRRAVGQIVRDLAHVAHSVTDNQSSQLAMQLSGANSGVVAGSNQTVPTTCCSGTCAKGHNARKGWKGTKGETKMGP